MATKIIPQVHSQHCTMGVKLQQLEALLETLSALGHHNRKDDPDWPVESHLLQLAGDMVRDVANMNRAEVSHG